jgi:hypothetical protein
MAPQFLFCAAQVVGVHVEASLPVVLPPPQAPASASAATKEK